MTAPTPPSRRATWGRPVALLALSLACAWIIVGLVGRIDWDAVLDAIRRLALWQVPILLAVLAVRQVLNASPLALFIDGLGLSHAVQNDQAATMMSTVAPPPADLVLRLSMFKSWGIPVSQGPRRGDDEHGDVLRDQVHGPGRRAGVPPCFGRALPRGLRLDRRPWGRPWLRPCSSILWAVLRRESAAVRVGTSAGRLGARVRKSVDPESWAASAVDFRSHVVLRSRDAACPASLALLVVMVVVDALLLMPLLPLRRRDGCRAVDGRGARGVPGQLPVDVVPARRARASSTPPCWRPSSTPAGFTSS